MDDQTKGVVLAASSSLFIGASFIIKKKGLRKAGASGVRAGAGGYAYLAEPLWWAGMLTMVLGEVANFAAYAFAPAIVVTPLGALSIIVSAVLAHIMLNEKLHPFGMVGCLLCMAGSLVIVLHAPEEGQVHSITDIMHKALQPGFVMYASLVVLIAFVLAVHVAPTHGTQQIMVYISICSLVGSLSVMSVKALGIALKLTFEGNNQLLRIETAICILIVALCIITQMNYLNKALDVFNTAVVSPIYYVTFTTATIVASGIMFKDFERQSAVELITEVCGFITILAGVFLLHMTKDYDGTGTFRAPLTLNSPAQDKKQDEEPEGVNLLPVVRNNSFDK